MRLSDLVRQEPTTWIGIITIVAGEPTALERVNLEVQAISWHRSASQSGAYFSFCPDRPQILPKTRRFLPSSVARYLLQPLKPHRSLLLMLIRHASLLDTTELVRDASGVVHDAAKVCRLSGNLAHAVPPVPKSTDPTLAHRPGFHTDGP